MARPGKRRRNGGNRAATDTWERRQLYATIARLAIEIMQPLIERFIGGGGPGHLL